MESIQEQVAYAFKTICEMLEDRGIKTENLKKIGNTNLEQLSGSQSIFTFEVNENILLIFYLTKMKISEFKNAMFGKVKDIDTTSMEQYNNKKCIFIFKDEITTQNRKSILEYWNYDTCQIFHIKELQYNISKHILVPKHELLKNIDEINAFFKKYNIKSKAQMPTIHRDDPMARYLGMSIGDIVKITRPSLTAGFYNYYRVCVA
jgi:DNA-directed RNA polymerase I, II, and III subunit RPABC1